jgi:hypothetical protein
MDFLDYFPPQIQQFEALIAPDALGYYNSQSLD